LYDGVVTALRDLDFQILERESVGLVGETGCGKSMLALSVLRLVPHPGRIVKGSIAFKGVELTKLNSEEMRGIRGARISMIFQDPSSSLDPVFTVEHHLSEIISLHQGIRDADKLRNSVLEMLRIVKIAAPETVMKQYPHELSGGMKQRVMIAKALCTSPTLIMADEPTTALDVTIQAQILQLLKDLVAVRGSSLLLITHNLGIVAKTCDRVCVMYAGRIVEQALTGEFFESPKHPYSVGLLNAFPKRGSRSGELSAIRGTVPNLMHLSPGCAFCERCDRSMDICASEMPRMVETARGHFVECHLYGSGGENAHDRT
jgi:oligopeptide/dipeptide ABC transporter ATP-binding protein